MAITGGDASDRHAEGGVRVGVLSAGCTQRAVGGVPRSAGHGERVWEHGERGVDVSERVSDVWCRFEHEPRDASIGSQELQDQRSYWFDPCHGQCGWGNCNRL